MRTASSRLLKRRAIIQGLLLAGPKYSPAESPSEIFGVRLTPSGSRLLQRIEEACGKLVIARKASLPVNLAEGGIREDGTPIVEVRPDVPVTEELVVHELS